MLSNITSSGFEYERIIEVMQQQQEAMAAIIVVLGAILGALIFRHLRK